ncbi:MAG: metal-dependent hydrolase [Nannocystaceae bacterium]
MSKHVEVPPELGPIRPRVVGFRFEDVPRHWLAGGAAPTAMANALGLLFPLGERFFIRSVRRYMDQVSPEMKAQIRGFFGQEGRHAHEHERFFAIMRAQGIEIQRFLDFYERTAFGGLERLFGPKMRLSVTVALEHYTAIFAEDAIGHGMIDRAHPVMRDLLGWHAAEEIEHKAVAFDVLKEVDPRYCLRIAGLALATVALVGYWFLATFMLLRQEEGLTLRETLRQLREVQRVHPIGRMVFLRGIREYLRRDFHPWQNDNLAMARDFLAGLAPANA